MKDLSLSAPKRRPSIVRTAGEALEDGTLLELLSPQPRSTQLALLCRQGKRSWTGRRIRLGSRLYTPADIPESVLRQMCLPAKPASCRSARALFDALVQNFRDTLRLPTREAQVSAYFDISTTFVDCLRIAPCLTVFAAETGDALQYLQVLGASSRHALTLADLQSGGVSQLPRGLYPTLLFCQSAFSSAAVRSLLASQHRGFGVLQRAGIADLYCAKAMIVDEGTPEDLAAMPCAQIYLAPDRDLPVVSDAALKKIAMTFQPRLLDYRLKNHVAVRNSTFDVPQFEGPIREMARAFGACIVDDPELQAGVVAVLRAEDEATRGARWIKPDSLVVEALMVVCHEPGRTSVYVGDLTKVLNGILAGRQETVELESRRVGQILRSLNLVGGRDAKGYGFLLLNEVRRRIHALARRLDVPQLRENVERCDYCAAALDGSG